MNKQLLEAAQKILKWYDDEDESNPHSTDQWKEAYDDLRKAVNNFSVNPPVSRCKIFFQKIFFPFYFTGWLLWQFITDDK